MQLLCQVSCRTDLPPLCCRDYNAYNQYSQTSISLSSQTPPSRRYLMYAVYSLVFGLRMRLSYSPRGALSDIEIQLHKSNSETKHRSVQNATEFSFRKCRNVERRWVDDRGDISKFKLEVALILKTPRTFYPRYKVRKRESVDFEIRGVSPWCFEKYTTEKCPRYNAPTFPSTIQAVPMRKR